MAQPKFQYDQELLRKISLISVGLLVGLFVLATILAVSFFFLNFTKYEDPKERFSLWYPKAWSIQPVQTRGGLVGFVAPLENKLDTFPASITITAIDLSRRPMALDEYVAQTSRQMTGVLGGVTEIGSQPVTISGKPGHKLVFQVKGGLEMIFVIFSFVSDEAAYNITYAARAHRYQYLLDRVAIELVWRSFRSIF